MIWISSTKLARWIAKRNMTASGLADASGVNRDTIYDILNDPQRASRRREQTAGDLAQALRLDIDDIIADKDEVESIKDHTEPSPVLPRSELDAPAAGAAHPFTFDTFIADRTRGFVGRAFVTDTIDAFLGSHESGYIVLEGEPGIGKSAVLAKLVQDRVYEVHHFNSANLGITSPRQFLENIASRISASLKLQGLQLPTASEECGAFLIRLLDQASRCLEEGARLVIAIDALDEVDMGDLKGLRSVLFLPPALPRGVFIVATTRDFKSSLIQAATIRLIPLKGMDPDNKADVSTYLANWAKRPTMNTWLKDHRVSAARFVDELLAKSQGNFMYLRYVLPELENGPYNGLDLESIPAGLEAYYEDHWRRMGMHARPLPEMKIRVIYVLAAMKRPVAQDLLAHFAALTPLQVQEVLEEWWPFIAQGRDDGLACYSLYHASFRDFLYRKDIVKAAGVSLPSLDASIADRMAKDLLG